MRFEGRIVRWDGTIKYLYTFVYIMSRVVPTRLPRELVGDVDRLVRSRRYRNRSEVLKEATRLLVSSGDVSSPFGMAKAASRIASLVIAWNAPSVKAIVLYGSAARGEATLQSDIDMLVVVKDGEPWKVRRRLYELIYPIMVGLNLDISLMVVTSAGWKKMAREGDPLVASILKDGRPLWGRLEHQA